MKNIFNTIVGLLFLVMLATSCKEKIDIDVPNGDAKLVVEAEVTTETDSSYVRLTKSVNYYSSTPYPAITNAVVLVNTDTFYHVANGIYKPKSPYKAITDSTYKLNIIAEGKTYTSESKLTPMFQVDSLIQVYKEKQGFLKEGFTVKYLGSDMRVPIKYTYFRFGKNDLQGNDSLFDFKVLFDNGSSNSGNFEFELPFLRLKKNEYTFLIFRTIDKNMFDFITAYNNQTSGAPGPFQVPPANLPTNIVGGALGYFATYDVVRKRITIK